MPKVSQWRLVFARRSFNMEFASDKVALRPILLRFLLFFFVNMLPPLLYFHPFFVWGTGNI